MPTQVFMARGSHQYNYDKVAKSQMAQQQFSQCGDRLDLKEEVVEKLFNTRDMFSMATRTVLPR